MVGPTMNLISGIHYSYERKEYAFMVLREYTIISQFIDGDWSATLNWEAWAINGWWLDLAKFNEFIINSIRGWVLEGLLALGVVGLASMLGWCILEGIVVVLFIWSFEIYSCII